MLKNIKSNLSSPNLVKKDDLNTKIYITVKSFLIIYKEYNNFFQSKRLEFEISNKIMMKLDLSNTLEMAFFDDESNQICLYSHEKKCLIFEQYYHTPEIEDKMSVFILKKIPHLGKTLKNEMEEEIKRRQDRLLLVLEEKDEKPKKTEAKDEKEESNSHEQTLIIQQPLPITQKYEELVVDSDFIILS